MVELSEDTRNPRHLTGHRPFPAEAARPLLMPRYVLYHGRSQSVSVMD